MNHEKIFIGVGVASVLFAVADFVYEKHPHVRFESWFNFYGFFALVAAAAMLAVAVLTRSVLERGEDYYDE